MLANCLEGNKNTIIIGITKDLTDKINLNSILRKLNINGGGQNNLVIGSIKSKIDIEQIIDILCK